MYAAASLTSTFEEIGKQFEAEHDGVKVEFNFGGSSDLVTQIQEGAPADVFASADTKPTWTSSTDADLAGDDPAGLRDQHPRDRRAAGQPGRDHDASQDLAKKGLQAGRLRSRGPVRRRDPDDGRAASGVTLTPVSEEQSVTDVLAKVDLGRGRRRRSST